jgi:glycosyltransferase involved in cell wall biosynthesis
MEVILSHQHGSGRAVQSEALQAVRIASASGEAPMLLAYHPVANVNPYQTLVYRRFAESGIGVLPLYDAEDSMSLAALARLGVSVVFHLHWTNWVLKAATSAEEAEALVDRAVEWLDRLRTNGIALVWTIHNVLPHDVVFKSAEARLQQWLAHNVDVVHIMHAGTVSAVSHIMDVPVEKTLVIPHPSYVGAYPDLYSKEQARAILNLDPDEIVYVIAGALKAYKGIGTLLPALDGLGADPPRRLLVAGKPDESNEARAFVRECTNHARVLIDSRTVPDSIMSLYLRAADMAVLPYARTLNSGAVLLALSFGLPIIAPALGAMAEILTDECAEIYDPSTPDGLEVALQKADRLLDAEAGAAARRLADRFDADALSRQFAQGLRRRLTRSD